MANLRDADPTLIILQNPPGRLPREASIQKSFTTTPWKLFLLVILSTTLFCGQPTCTPITHSIPIPQLHHPVHCCILTRPYRDEHRSPKGHRTRYTWQGQQQILRWREFYKVINNLRKFWACKHWKFQNNYFVFFVFLSFFCIWVCHFGFALSFVLSFLCCFVISLSFLRRWQNHKRKGKKLCRSQENGKKVTVQAASGEQKNSNMDAGKPRIGQRPPSCSEGGNWQNTWKTMLESRKTTRKRQKNDEKMTRTWQTNDLTNDNKMTKQWHHKTGMEKNAKTKWQKNDTNK